MSQPPDFLVGKYRLWRDTITLVQEALPLIACSNCGASMAQYYGGVSGTTLPCHCFHLNQHGLLVAGCVFLLERTLLNVPSELVQFSEKNLPHGILMSLVIAAQHVYMA